MKQNFTSFSSSCFIETIFFVVDENVPQGKTSRAPRRERGLLPLNFKENVSTTQPREK